FRGRNRVRCDKISQRLRGISCPPSFLVRHYLVTARGIFCCWQSDYRLYHGRHATHSHRSAGNCQLAPLLPTTTNHFCEICICGGGIHCSAVEFSSTTASRNPCDRAVMRMLPAFCFDRRIARHSPLNAFRWLALKLSWLAGSPLSTPMIWASPCKSNVTSLSAVGTILPWSSTI